MDSISPETVRIAGNHSDNSGAFDTLCGLFGLRGKLMEGLGVHDHVGLTGRSTYRYPRRTTPSDGLAP